MGKSWYLIICLSFPCCATNPFTGTGFATFDLPAPLNRVTLGICMDLNPQTPSWTLESGPYEIAEHCMQTDTKVLLLLNAWLDSKADTDNEHDGQTIDYWAARLRPLWTRRNSGESRPASAHGANGTVVIVCNRSGEEDGESLRLVDIARALSFIS
jgi:protein N-terminal amidase